MEKKKKAVIITLICITFLMIPACISSIQRQKEVEEAEGNSIVIDIHAELKEQIKNECFKEYEMYFESSKITVDNRKKYIKVRFYYDYKLFLLVDTKTMNNIYNELYDIVFVENEERYGEFFLFIGFERPGYLLSLCDITKDKSQVRIFNQEERSIRELAEICPDTVEFDGWRIYDSLEEYNGFVNLKEINYYNMSEEEKDYISSLFPECKFGQCP